MIVNANVLMCCAAFVINPAGKSDVCILHEYAQHSMRIQPRYIFREIGTQIALCCRERDEFDERYVSYHSFVILTFALLYSYLYRVFLLFSDTEMARCEAAVLLSN